MPKILTRSDGAQDWLLFQLQGQAYALGIADVVEVLPMVALATIPGASATLEGMLDLRGSIVPVLDARRGLGLPARQPDLQTPILVVRLAERLVGLIVDLVLEVRSVPPEVVTPPDPLAGTAHAIAATARLDNRIVLLLDLEALFVGLPWTGETTTAVVRA